MKKTIFIACLAASSLAMANSTTFNSNGSISSTVDNNNPYGRSSTTFNSNGQSSSTFSAGNGGSITFNSDGSSSSTYATNNPYGRR
ncbi:hypothetical protein SAMN02982997_02561 [Legionella micdadei]|uniref:Uncharacterized protein n=1 Tax=Legionella micdadei TaxID=451 RepID=A0A1G5I234_LEGMI|nr:hypothetical protein Lmic_2129 [Legionella micdadei]SCY70126.1 hypothetical protein SAMN02982997_02561 [Legionella micdadei]